MNPLVQFKSKTNKDTQKFVDEFNKILCAMGVNEEEKAEFVAYHLKNLAQVWYKVWVDGREPGEVRITWDILKIAFLQRFFPKEQREAKFEEFINLRLEGMSVKEYSLAFVKLSKYDSFVLSSSMKFCE